MTEEAKKARAEYARKWRREHPEAVHQANRKYKQSHPEIVRQCHERYWERKAQEMKVEELNMETLKDAPYIRNAERTGYEDGRGPKNPVCPKCRSECSTIFYNSYGDLVGCDECISDRDAWDVEECFPEDRE